MLYNGTFYLQGERTAHTASTIIVNMLYPYPDDGINFCENCNMISMKICVVL